MDLKELPEKPLEEIKKAADFQSLENLRIRYLGKKGELAKITKTMGKLPPSERKRVGERVNEIKTKITKALKKKKIQISNHQLPITSFDYTFPGEKIKEGHLHLVSQAIFEIERIFSHLGFVRRRYPEVESDYYAFEVLNTPKDHPARDEMESFYITDSIVLTPHTSSGQVREIERGKLPIRMINIAKCYRRESDVGHIPMFHQFEGLLINKGVSITDLKGVFDFFIKNFFGPNRRTRLRPYDFRFTEPSVEVDVSCRYCEGKGCRLCKEGWVELGGAGMVHPKVIENGGMDAGKVNGFAFGWGVERTYMMKAGIKLPDVRMVYTTDLRILSQF